MAMGARPTGTGKLHPWTPPVNPKRGILRIHVGGENSRSGWPCEQLGEIAKPRQLFPMSAMRVQIVCTDLTHPNILSEPPLLFSRRDNGGKAAARTTLH